MNLEKFADSFWAHVEKTEYCWIWTGYRQKTMKGQFTYGRFTLPRPDVSKGELRQPFAHRVAWRHLIEDKGQMCRGAA